MVWNKETPMSEEPRVTRSQILEASRNMLKINFASRTYEVS